MNITILANKDVASCLALNYLLPDLQQHRLTVFLSSRVGSKPLAEPLQQLKFLEQELFNQIVFPLLPAVTDAGSLLGFEQIKLRLDGRLRELNTINTEGLADFAASEPDLVLSIRYGVILKEQALAVPASGVLNLHSGRLPDYKGVMATFWALLNGEQEIGTTLHYIVDSSIDTGPSVTTTSLPVQADKSYLWHVLELYKEGCRSMLRAVQALHGKQALAVTSQPTGGHYYSFPTARDLQDFQAKGYRLYDYEDVINLAKRFLPPQ